MKERPILFNDEMVRALLEGRKTQTRRVIKPQPPNYIRSNLPEWNALQRRCPFGQLGDQLWGRETHAIVPRTAYAQSTGVDQVLNPNNDYDTAVFREGWERSQPSRWRPSIHMPRWASRILLEVTDVRVERLQEISAEDARAEVCQQPDLPPDVVGVVRDHVADERTSFAILWNRINGPDSWHATPWVWVVDFKRTDDSTQN